MRSSNHLHVTGNGFIGRSRAPPAALFHAAGIEREQILTWLD